MINLTMNEFQVKSSLVISLKKFSVCREGLMVYYSMSGSEFFTHMETSTEKEMPMTFELKINKGGLHVKTKLPMKFDVLYQ